MSGLPPADLASAFTTSAKPHGLSGVLPPRPGTRGTDQPSTTPVPSEASGPERRKAKRHGERPSAARKTPSQGLRGAIVYVTPAQRDWIRSHISSTRTITDVVLDAIETHQSQLTPPVQPVPADGGALFARHTKPEPQDGVQVQLRMTQANVDVLDTIVRDKAFPSRSALVRAALSAAAGGEVLR